MLSGHDLGGDFPENSGHTILLHEKVGPVTGKIRNFIGEIHVTDLFELFNLMLRSNLIKHRFQFVVLQNIVLDPFNLPSNAEGRLLAGHEV